MPVSHILSLFILCNRYVTVVGSVCVCVRVCVSVKSHLTFEVDRLKKKKKKKKKKKMMKKSAF